MTIVDGGTFYYRVNTKNNIDEKSIVSSINGISEKACVLRCRRLSKCNSSVYEDGHDGKKSSQCLLLSDYQEAKERGKTPTMLHKQIPIIGIDF